MPSFPRKRESIFLLFAWQVEINMVPAFAGMTTCWKVRAKREVPAKGRGDLRLRHLRIPAPRVTNRIVFDSCLGSASRTGLGDGCRDRVLEFALSPRQPCARSSPRQRNSGADD